MDALKNLGMATSNSCRSNSIPRRWGWLSFTFCVVLSCCLLLSPSESASIQAGYVWNGDPAFANIAGPTTYKKVSTTFLASSPNEKYALVLIIETSKTSGPVCYLDVYNFYESPDKASAPAPPPGSSASTFLYPWTHPCPRTPLPNGNCTFAFTKDGDIQLWNSSVLLWSSNTTGLGATTLAMRDYDMLNILNLDGHLVLYNSSGDIVWANVRNDSNFQCGDPAWQALSTSQAAATKKKASVTSLMYVALISLGAALIMSLWDSRTARSGRDQLLVVGFVVCCLLLPSTSESIPIQAGNVSITLQFLDITVTEPGSIGYTTLVAESPAKRTAVYLHGSVISNWGVTCYLEVVADRQSTNVVYASAPAPSTALNTFDYVPWSAPCPRKLSPNFVSKGSQCVFTFKPDGEIQVTSGNEGLYDFMWSSNTSDLGATTLDVLDSDPTGIGSVVLYNANKDVVWRNVLNMTNQDFQCDNPSAKFPSTRSNAGIIAGISIGAVAAFLLLGLFVAHQIFRNWRRTSYRKQGEFSLVDQSLVPRMFTYKELNKATKKFSKSEILGSGGFGAVYKGTLPSGGLIAVKRMRNESKHGKESFQAEVASLSHIRHRNLVQLRGWCHEKDQLLLVYDYMCNGSLDEWLFHFSNGEASSTLDGKEALPLNLRHSILCGVAAALAYLHVECPQCVLHRDIKSSNVLLDAGLNAYLGDFGLARLIDHQKMEKTTMMAGTFGYMAPEMPHTGKATKESDVYSFGVLMLEVVCGRRALDMGAIERGEPGILVDRVWRAHEAGHVLEMVDRRLEAFPPSFEENLGSRGEIDLQEASLIVVADNGMLDVDPSTINTLDSAMIDKKLIANLLHLGLLCCNPISEDRPSMRVVSQLLQSSEADMEMYLPPLPDYKPHARYSRQGSSEVAMPWSSWSSSSGPHVQDTAQGSSQSASNPPSSGVSPAEPVNNMLTSFAAPNSSVFSGR